MSDDKKISGGLIVVNVGDLTKPATVLIEKIAEAAGVLWEPNQIVRVAKAQAEAAKIRAEAEIEITDLQRRALRRFVAEEGMKQGNMETIIQQALPQLNENADPSEVEDDWIANFFDKCRLISDSEMQALWSRILAGEANSPGSFSKRTVNFLSSLDKSDTETFTRLCAFCWVIGDVTPLVLEFRDDIYNRNGITFDSLRHLDSIGLIQFQGVVEYMRTRLPHKFQVFYYGQPTLLLLPAENDNTVKIGHTLFTQIGRELVLICGPQPNPEFREYVLAKWKELGYIKDENTLDALSSQEAAGD